MTPSWMTAPKDATFVFLAISWGEQGDEDSEAFGPFVVREDGSHLQQVEGVARRWRAEHSGCPNMAVHLFATSPAQRVTADVKAAYEAVRQDVERMRPLIDTILALQKDAGEDGENT
jgi:hypothetical protein